ncbi:hypothetical protein [Kitasatospora cathayae]|uniref:Uncharacterized protein n=1 Tax=Kitasatospora cathayae TaxID=3004092 RepID=A0ABY7QBF1_9ACTN|nr:hypothetical protein [Kitasatospora sp. HUAS 3-15]WBP90078.1 hypothetical protein O1G21_32310 [Kitasatospora sp. HUAS 3-15]
MSVPAAPARGNLVFGRTGPAARRFGGQTQSSIRGLTYGRGQWSAVGDQGVILSSSDGFSWHLR